MDDQRAPRHLVDPPAPPSSGRPSAAVSQPRATSSSIEVPRRQTSELSSSRDASLFQELLRGFGEMRERMIAAESRVDFLSNLLPEIWARMASQEATTQTSQRNMAETTQEARVQAAQASMAAERSQEAVERLKEMLAGDEEARAAAATSALDAKDAAQRSEVLAARLEEQIRALAAAHAEISGVRQAVQETSEKTTTDARAFFSQAQRLVDAALRETKSLNSAAAEGARDLHQETRRTSEDTTARLTRLAQELADKAQLVNERIEEDEARRAEQARWVSESEAAIGSFARQAAQAADQAAEHAALMELREQNAATARETTMKSVENMMRSARETVVASRDAGDEIISQAKEASTDAAVAAAAAEKAKQEALDHALGAAEAHQREDDAAAEAVKAAAAAAEVTRLAAKTLEEQKDMTSVARQVARSAEEARAASEAAADRVARAEEAARAAAGEANRVSTAEVDRVAAFESSVEELRAAASEAFEAAETTRSLLWQIASDEAARGETAEGLAARYDKELRSLEGAVQSARGAARSAQEAARAARSAKEEATEDAGQVAVAAAQATRAVVKVETPATEDKAASDEPSFEVEAAGDEDDPAFWERRELEGELLLENDQDAMWVERFRKAWTGRGKREESANGHSLED